MKVDATLDHIIVIVLGGGGRWLYVSNPDTSKLIVGSRNSKHRINNYTELLLFSSRKLSR